MPHSKIKVEIARVLKSEGYINDYAVEGSEKKSLRVYLKYDSEMEPVLQGIKRESKQGLRHYVSTGEIPRVLRGMGVAVLSTSSGVMTGKEARKKNIGGELLCSVW
jgi:small subunit ribosomal protein S8